MLKNFKVEVEVDAKHHYSLIGRRGVVISKIQQLHDVQVQFPEKGSDRPNTIVITGLEKNAEAAQKDILKKVQELVSLRFVKWKTKVIICRTEFSLNFHKSRLRMCLKRMFRSCRLLLEPLPCLVA